MTNGIIFCVCLTLAISFRWRKSHSKVETDNGFCLAIAAQGILTCLPLLHRKARGKPDMKVNYFWARKLSSIIEQGDLFRTLTHQVTQSAMLTRIGLLKSGNLMKWWFVYTAHGQICCWWRWYGLQHRRRIRHVVRIQIILAQGEWSSAKDAGPIVKGCNTRQQQTFFNMVNVYVFVITSICIHGKELLRNFTLHQKYRKGSHFETDVWHIRKVDSRTFRWDLWSEYN